MRHIIVAFFTITLFVSTGCIQVFAQNDSYLAQRPALQRQGNLASRAAERMEIMLDRRENFASKAAQRREAREEKLAEHREQIASRAAELKERLADFKDKRKAALAEKINSVLAMINEKRTEAMNKHLEKMSELLDKLANRVSEKGSQGLDTSEADSAIASASAAIDTASDAVEAQALKDYTIEVSSESGVRSDVKEARDGLHADLQIVRQLIINAKQEVAKAIKIAATTLGGIGEGDSEATGAGSQ